MSKQLEITGLHNLWIWLLSLVVAIGCAGLSHGIQDVSDTLEAICEAIPECVVEDW